MYILDVGRDRVVQGKKVADAPWLVKLFIRYGLKLRGLFGDMCVVLSWLVVWKVKVVLGDESGVVLLTLWPPANRFHGAMLAASEKATAECFPMAKLSRFD